MLFSFAVMLVQFFQKCLTIVNFIIAHIRSFDLSLKVFLICGSVRFALWKHSNTLFIKMQKIKKIEKVSPRQTFLNLFSINSDIFHILLLCILSGYNMCIDFEWPILKIFCRLEMNSRISPFNLIKIESCDFLTYKSNRRLLIIYHIPRLKIDQVFIFVIVDTLQH